LAEQAKTGNGCPSGAHYNLNIIGKDKTKNIDPDSITSQGRRIFVQLGKKDNAATTKIMLEEGETFAVLDYDGTDGRAAFQLPNPDPDGDGITAYSVYLRVLGKPGGKIRMYTSATDPDIGEVASDLRVVSVREKGQRKFANVSAELLFIYAWVYVDGEWTYQAIPLFSELLQGYLWSYDNNGLRIAQLRFYEGVPTEVPDPLAIPHLASISPHQGTQGASLEVVISGANTDFNGPNDDLPSTVDFGDGITVNSTTVSSDTLITTQIAIAGDAAVGWRQVSVTCADGSVMSIFFEVVL
ncbi:MAG: IPT/TIG domain-containing protein, partial [Phycisphaerales bacterium]